MTHLTLAPDALPELTVKYHDVLKMVGVDSGDHARRMQGLRTTMNAQFNAAVQRMETAVAELLSRAHQSHEQIEGMCEACIARARIECPWHMEQLKIELGLPTHE